MTPHRIPARCKSPRLRLLWMLLAMVPAACQQPARVAANAVALPAPEPPCIGADTPERAVIGLVQALHDGKLERIPCLATPPMLQVRLALAWREGRSTWPVSELPLGNKLPAVLEALSKPDAQQTLEKGFDSQFAGKSKELRDAARGLGLFAVRYIQKENQYDANDRAHHAALVIALTDWVETLDLGDRTRAHQAIAMLVDAARKTGMANHAALTEAGMSGALQHLDMLLAGAKQVVQSYGLSPDETLASIHASRTTLTSGEQARVHIIYHVASKTIETDVDVVNREGHWYCANLLRDAEKAADAPFIKTEPVLVH